VEHNWSRSQVRSTWRELSLWARKSLMSEGDGMLAEYWDPVHNIQRWNRFLQHFVSCRLNLHQWRRGNFACIRSAPSI